jgi:hypothetical protein
MNDTNTVREAMVTVTVKGQQGDIGPVAFDAADADIKRWVTEAVAAGGVAGIDAIQADFDDYIVDRFEARDGLPDRIMMRPKTPFGARPCGDGCCTHPYTGIIMMVVPDGKQVVQCCKCDAITTTSKYHG